MRINPEALKKREQRPTLTTMQHFVAILKGMHLVQPIADTDGVMTGIFLQVDKNGSMAVDGHIPFDTESYRDMRAEVVKNQLVVVGRKTFEQDFNSEWIPYSRQVIVLTHQDMERPSGNIYIAHSPKEVIRHAKELGAKRVWVPGGAETVEAMLPWSDLIFISCASAEAPGTITSKYPQAVANTVYGDGMVWPEASFRENGVTFSLNEYHRRDSTGRQYDEICAKCPFSAGCNGWEYSTLCLSGKFHPGLRGGTR